MKTPDALPTARGPATRLLLALLICALMLVWVTQAAAATSQVGGSSPTVAPAPGAATPTVAATLEQCVSTGEQANRSATFSGEMTAIAGAARMEMRVEVQERLPEEELFHTVSAPGLGVWRGSNSGVKIYQYVKQVTNLSGPADYRGLVRFHWLNDKGYVIKRAERHTLQCVQPAFALTPAPTTPGASTGTTTTPPATG